MRHRSTEYIEQFGDVDVVTATLSSSGVGGTCQGIFAWNSGIGELVQSTEYAHMYVHMYIIGVA